MLVLPGQLGWMYNSRFMPKGQKDGSDDPQKSLSALLPTILSVHKCEWGVKNPPGISSTSLFQCWIQFFHAAITWCSSLSLSPLSCYRFNLNVHGFLDGPIWFLAPLQKYLILGVLNIKIFLCEAESFTHRNIFTDLGRNIQAKMAENKLPRVPKFYNWVKTRFSGPDEILSHCWTLWNMRRKPGLDDLEEFYPSIFASSGFKQTLQALELPKSPGSLPRWFRGNGGNKEKV